MVETTATIKKYKVSFTQVSNIVLNDPNLSLRAKGLYAYLFSKPDGWEFHPDIIAKDLQESIKTIRATTRELIDCGYIDRTQSNQGGKFGGIIYTFLDPTTKEPCDHFSAYGKKVTHNNTESITNTETKNSFINKTIKKLSLFADYEYLFDALEQWLQYKQSRRQSYKSDKSILIFCKHLHELSGGNVDIAMQVVEQSMANNWSGIFPLKNQPFASNVTEDELNSFVDMWNTMVNRLAPRGEFVNGNKVRSIVADDVRIMLPDAKRNLLCMINEIKNWGKLPLAINVPLDGENYWNWALIVVANRLLRSSYLRGQAPNAPMFTFDVKFFCYNIKKLANPYDECYLDR